MKGTRFLGVIAPRKAFSLALAFLVAVAAWGGSRTFASSSAHAPSKAARPKFFYITPNPIGADAFLQLGVVGVNKAAKEFHATAKVLQASDPTTRQQDVNVAINSGATIITTTGFEFNDIVAKTAPAHSNVQFLMIDTCTTGAPPKNVRCATFREYEDTYLLGVAAGKLTKTNRIAAIGAEDIPLLHRYTVGFTEGAQSVNPKVKVDVRWIASNESGFSDPAKAKEDALALAANHDDQIMAAASASNSGIFEAAIAKNFFSYGVDVNQCPMAPGHIVDNAVKRVDVAMEIGIREIMHHRGAQMATYGVKSGGMTLTSLSSKNPMKTQCVLARHPTVLALVKRVRSEIISGKIRLKDPAKQ
jgi:basic membrane protein A